MTHAASLDTPRRTAPARLVRRQAATQLVVRDQPLILLAGELRNSSAACVDDVQRHFDRLVRLNLNAVLAPVSWELIEPEEGRYDFTLFDAMVQAARERDLHLIPLWFGTLKNAISCYVPRWVKTDLTRFPRAQTTPGRSSWTVSPFCDEALRCGQRAFAAVMARLRELDADHGTAPMVQVENEPGILGGTRDRGPEAERAFAQPVPEALVQYLHERVDRLDPWLAQRWQQNGQRRAGSWSELFGRDADELFMAWHIARFVGQVAAAGRAEYDLPMFANAWLPKGPGYQPGQYPSGGPLARLIDVWRAAAPSLDVLAPDIYQDDFRGHCEAFHRREKPLLIPEARHDAAAAGRALYALGRHAAIGFAPFAIDDCPADHPIGEMYHYLRHLLPTLAEAQAAGRVTAFLQQADEERFTAELGRFRFVARSAGSLTDVQVPGAALILQLDGDVFSALGRNLIVTFEPRDPQEHTAALIWLDEGRYEHNDWQPIRRLNGDESAHGTGLLMADRWCSYQFALHSYT